MVNLVLIQALPQPRLESRENLALALRYLEKCRGQGADLICFPEYFPFLGDQELARAARSLQAYVVAGLLEEAGWPLFRGPAASPQGRSITGPPGAGLGRSPGVAGPYRGRGRGDSRRGPGPGRSPALASGHLSALREAPLTRGHRP
ncbi:MAG: hypothetical protein ABIG94_09475 [Pseudomonadota bacterium]